MKKLGASIALSLYGLLPMVALAQANDNFGEVGTFVENISGFINNTLIPLVFAIALLVFLYGVFKYFILGGGDDDSRKEGRQLMLYAIIGFVVMVSIFGIVNLIAGGLGFSGEQLEDIPDAPTSNN